MRRAALLALLLLVTAATGVATAADPQPTGPASSAPQPQFSMDEIEREIMCPTCETPLYLSHSPAANRIRAYVEEKREAGWTKQQVKDALVAQFGERILATTPTSGSGLFAWLVPVIAGIAGVALAVGLVVVWRRRPGRPEPVTAAGPLDDEARRRVDEALRDFE